MLVVMYIFDCLVWLNVKIVVILGLLLVWQIVFLDVFQKMYWFLVIFVDIMFFGKSVVNICWYVV